MITIIIIFSCIIKCKMYFKIGASERESIKKPHFKSAVIFNSVFMEEIIPHQPLQKLL